MKYFGSWFGLVLLFLMLHTEARAQQAAAGMESRPYNLQDFPQARTVDRELWLKVNKESDLTHPEALNELRNKPCENCVEQLEQRSVSGRVFVNPMRPSETYRQSSLNALHYQNPQGHWVSVDHHLKPTTANRYEAPNQWAPAGLDAANQYTWLSEKDNRIRFNQWELWGSIETGEKRLLHKANWSRRTVGEDGMMVFDLFPGIDAEVLFLRGAVKTNFIVKAALDLPYATLWIRDHYNSDADLQLSFDQGQADLQSTDVLIRTPMQELRMGRAVSFPAADRKAFRYLNYLLEGQHVSIEVGKDLFNNPSASYPLFIDPLVSNTNSVAQAAVNYYYNATCNFDFSCDYPLTVNTPANATVTDITFNYDYIATFPCYMMDAANRMLLANCVSPNLPGYYWFCNTAGSGTCTGNNISFLSDIAPCVPAPSCPPIPLNFMVQFFKSCWGNTGCSNICVAAGTDFSITVQGHTLEFNNPGLPVTASPATVCVNGSSTLSTGGAIYGVPPYTYVWSDNPSGLPVLGTGTSLTLPFNTPGTTTLYVMVTDACGTSISAPVTVTVVNGPTFTAIPTAPSCPGGSNGSIAVSPNGGGSFNYALNPGGATASGASAGFSGLPPGTYTVSVSTTGAGACTATQVVVVPNPSALLWNSVSSTAPSCGNTNDGSVVVSAGGGTPGFTYTLMPGNLTNGGGSFSNLGGGSYTVTATDAGGCTLSTLISLTQPAPISWSTWTVSPVGCFGIGNGSINATATGGTGTLNYNLMPGNSNNTNGQFNALGGGTYTVTVTDVNGCTAVSVTTVAEPAAISFQSTVSTPATCNGIADGSVTVGALGGTGGLNYNLQPGNMSNGTGTFPGLPSGNYTITVTDANGCSSSTVLSVSAPPALQVSVLNTLNAGCGLNNGGISFGAAGGTPAYSWVLQPGGALSGNGSFAGLGGNVTYTVTVTDANGCTGSGSGLVGQSSPSPISGIATTAASCVPGGDGTLSVTMPGAGPFSYLLNPGGITSATGSYVNLGAGTYTVTVTDANNCTASSTALVAQLQAPVWVSAVSSPTGCSPANSGSITVQASGNGTLNYALTPGNFNNATGTFTTLTAGTYTVVVAAAGNCTASTVLSVNGTPSPTVSNVSTVSPTCTDPNGGSLTATGSGGTPPYSYSIGGAYTGAATFSGLAPGSYVVTVKDANGCTGSSVVQLSGFLPPTLTLSAVQPPCHGGDGGSVQAYATGNGPFAFALMPGNMNNSTGLFSGLGAGVYLVTVTDVNGCSTVKAVTLTDPPAITWTTLSSGGSTCSSEATGTIQAKAEGGAGGISYTLQPGALVQMNGNFNGLLAGLYTVTATDAQGCTGTRSIAIEEARCCDKVFIPNVFSPNRDMLNDEFRIRLSPGFVMETLLIYDRWGKQIWRSTQAFDNWDGRYLGTDCPIGTYFYHYTYVCEDTGEKFSKQGDVLLIR